MKPVAAAMLNSQGYTPPVPDIEWWPIAMGLSGAVSVLAAARRFNAAFEAVQQLAWKQFAGWRAGFYSRFRQSVAICDGVGLDIHAGWRIAENTFPVINLPPSLKTRSRRLT